MLNLNIDFWQLFTVLLATAILQSFIIQPGVELLKKYYRKIRAHMEKIK
jgi:hypothetical protein